MDAWPACLEIHACRSNLAAALLSMVWQSRSALLYNLPGSAMLVHCRACLVSCTHTGSTCAGPTCFQDNPGAALLSGQHHEWRQHQLHSLWNLYLLAGSKQNILRCLSLWGSVQRQRCFHSSSATLSLQPQLHHHCIMSKSRCLWRQPHQSASLQTSKC